MPLRRLILVVGSVFAVATCRDSLGPRASGGLAAVAVAPVLPASDALADFGLTIDRVRIIVIRPVRDTLADTTVALPPDADFLDLSLRVPLEAPSEQLDVTIVALAGATPLFSGTSPVEVRSGATPPPVEIPVLTYVGPGAGVDSIAVIPGAPFIFLNDSLRFQIQAFQGGVPVTQFYVGWSTSDTTVARINGFGVLRAPNARTSVVVRARTPSGIADSVTATFVPLPTQLVEIGGNGQTGAVGQILETPLEVEVRAADGLPVGGVAVRFRTLSGGLPADTTVTADAAGRARVLATLGGGVGPQSFEASLPAFGGVPAFTFGATATAGAISAATSLITVSTGTIASGSSVTLTLRARDAGGNNLTTGGATVVFSASGGTSTGSIGPTLDNLDGTYTASFAGFTAGTPTTIGARINGDSVTTALPTVSVTPGPVSTATSVVSVSSASVLSGGTATLRLAARDAAGNTVGVGGATVVFSVAGGTSTGAVGATADSGNGVYTAPFTGDSAGTALTVGATINGVAVTSPLPTILVLPGAASPATSLVLVSSDTTASAAGVTLTLEARDAAGNPRTTGGDTVVFSHAGGTSTGVIGATTDSGTGRYTATFTGVTAGTPTTIAATINGAAVTTALPTVTVIPGPVTAVTVSPPTASLAALGDTQPFTAEARDTNGNVVAAPASWSATPSGIVTIDSAGGATAIANGSVTIVGTVAGVSGTASLTVAQVVTAVAVSPAVDTIRALGNSRVFVATAKDANDSVVAGETFTWQSSDGAVAIVDTTGIATAVGNGSASITATATSNGTSGVAVLAVSQVIMSVSVTPSVATLTALGASEPFTAVALDSNANVVSGAAFVWSSSDTAVATIDAAGIATAVANGTATIVAAAGGVADSAGLSVAQVATRLAFTVEPTTAAAGSPIAPAVVVSAVDSLGSAVAAFTDSVTVVIGANPSGGVLSGTLTRAPALGAATFDDLAIDQPGIGYTLIATAAAVAADTSAAFDIAQPAATVFWSNALGGNWSDPANWSGGVVPALGDTAVIDLAGTYVVTVDVNDTVGGLRIGGTTGAQTLAVGASRTLGVGGAMLVGGNGTVNATSATLNGAGLLTNAGTLRLRSATINKPLANEATLLADGSSTLNGSVTTTGTSFLRVQGNGQTGFSQLTVALGFSNAGRIELTDSAGAHGARLTVSGGVLINASTGVLEAMPGAAGPRELALMLHNQGTVMVSHNLLLSQGGADHQNSGSIVVSGGTLTLSQSGTTPSFASTGVVRVDSGRTLAVNGGAFDYTSGSLEGRGTISFTNATANFAPAFSNDTLALVLTTTTLNGPGTLTVTPGDTLRVRGSTIAAPFVNQGAVLFDGSSGIAGAFVNEAGATLRIQGNGQTGFSQVTAANGFTNGGRIELTDSGGAHGARLTVSSGALVNASGGVIEPTVGSGGPRELLAVLDNRAGGTLAVSHNLTLNRASASHQNAGTISVTGGSLTLSQSGTAPSFTTSGTVTIGAGRLFAVSFGTFDYAGGNVGGLGTIAFTGVTANFTQSFSNDTLFMTLATTTLNGPGTITVTPGDTLRVRGSTIAAPLVNQGVLLFDGTSSITGSFAAATGSTVRVQGNGQTGFSQLTVATGFTNNGTIELTDSSGAHGSRLTVSTGALVNESGAVIRAVPGAGGSRELTAVLDNRAGGTVALTHNLTVNAAGADHINGGAILVSGGSLTLNQSGTTPSFTTGGSIAIDSGRTMVVNAGAFDYTSGTLGGRGTLALNNVTLNLTPSLTVDTLGVSLLSTTVNGPGTFAVAAGRAVPVRSSILNAPVVNQGALLVNGATTINGAITAAGGSLLRVQGNGSTGSSQLTVATAGGMTNDGQILLTDSSGAFGATLLVSGGPLVNGTTGTIRADTGAGGSRSLSATIDNRGTFQVALNAGQVLTTNVPSAAHVNGGALLIESGTFTVTGAGSSFTNASTGVIAGEGAFNTSSTSFVNDGAVDPGSPPGGAGILTVSGGYAQSTGALHVQLGGTTAGAQYDRLAVSGSAGLSGSLVVTLIDGFTPALGDTFTVATFGSRSGGFTSLSWPALSGGLTLDTLFTATSLQLIAVQPQLVFSQQPVSTVAGELLVPAVEVTALDGRGNPMTTFTGTVAIAIGTNPGGGTLSGTRATAAVGGVATFADLSIDVAAPGYTLIASASGFPDAASGAFDITLPATRLAFIREPPAQIFFGDTFTVQVAAQDDLGNTVTSFNSRIVISENAGSKNPLSTLQGVLDTLAVNGVATFTGLFVDGPDTTSIDAIADLLTPNTSITFAVVDQIVLQETGPAPYFAGVDTITNRVYVTNTDGFAAGGSATVVDGESQKVVGAVTGLGPNPGWEAVHAEKRQVLITEFVEGVLYVIDASQDVVEDALPLGGPATQPVIDPQSEFVYVPARLGVLSLVVVDMAQRLVSEFPLLQTSETPAGAARDPATGLIWVAVESTGWLLSVDPARGEVVDTVVVGESPYGVAIDPDRRRLYVTLATQNQVAVLNLDDTKAQPQLVTVGLVPQGISVDVKSGRVFVANYDDGLRSGTISVIDGDRGEVIKTITVGAGPGDAEFNPRNGLVYVPNGTDNSISIVKPN